MNFGVLRTTVVLCLLCVPALAQSPEQELGPEKMVLADAIAARMIDGIRHEGLRDERLDAAIRAWTDYHIKRREISQRDSTIIQLYVRKVVVRYRMGEPHIPYAERVTQRPGGR